jgi:ADP-ribose pyrophosphatase
MKLKEKSLSRILKFQGRIVNVYHDDIELPNGRHSMREVVTHPGGVCVAARDETGRFLIVEQFRYAFKREILEFPAGKLEPNEDPLEAALRELEEETGYVAHKMIALGELYPSVGYLTEVIFLFFASETSFKKQKLDTHEFLNVHRYTLEELLDMSRSGQINDAKTIALLHRLMPHL